MSDGLEIPNLDAVFAQIESWVEQQRTFAAQVAKGIAYHALQYITENSAQFSGDFAANWRVTRNTPSPDFTPQLFDITVHRLAGDPEAIDWARANNRNALQGFTLGEEIHLANNAEHEDLYGWLIENNQLKFRVGNKGRPLRDWHDVATVLFRHIDAATAEKLANATGGL